MVQVGLIGFSLSAFILSVVCARTTEEESVETDSVFWGSFVSSAASELGDKTFMLTAILASRYSKPWVFLGSMSALGLMTLLSCFIGNVSEQFIPQLYTKYLAALLFLYFGGKSLYEVITDTVDDEDDEVEEDLKIIEAKLSKKSLDKEDSCDKNDVKNEKKNKKIKSVSGPAIAFQSFLQNFFGEWGDSSQLTTVAMSASFQFWNVFFGSALGQLSSTLIALIGGTLVAKAFSEKTMANVTGVLFLFYGFAVIYSTFE